MSNQGDNRQGDSSSNTQEIASLQHSMTISYTSDDIQRELQRRRVQEYRSQIQEHQQAIRSLEERLEAIQTHKASAEPQEAPAAIQPLPPPRQEPRFGPCATTLLELIEASKIPVSESELLRCTRYSTVMFRKATSELLAAGKISKSGEPRKPLFSRKPQAP